MRLACTVLGLLWLGAIAIKIAPTLLHAVQNVDHVTLEEGFALTWRFVVALALISAPGLLLIWFGRSRRIRQNPP